MNIGNSRWERPTKKFTNGPITQAYSHWRHVIERSSEPYWKKYPSYIGTIMHKDWESYDCFYDWITTVKGYGELYNGKYYHLDKDLLGDGFTYEPKSCVLLPPPINGALIGFNSRGGDLPTGVSINQGRYLATLCYRGKNKNLGRYSDPYVAASVYRKAKAAYLKELAFQFRDDLEERAFEKLCDYAPSPSKFDLLISQAAL